MYKTYQELTNKKVEELERKISDLNEQIKALQMKRISIFDIHRKRKLESKK